MDTDITEMTKTGNEINGEGVRALGEALKANTTLTELNLSSVQKQQRNAKQRHNSKSQ